MNRKGKLVENRDWVLENKDLFLKEKKIQDFKRLNLRELEFRK